MSPTEPMVELTLPTPNWRSALAVALTRPAGVPERRRRTEEGEWPAPAERPRRIADDLAWLRQAFDAPDEHGLRHLADTAAVAAYEPEQDEVTDRLRRLRDRGVLDAAGFLLHD